MPTSNSKKAFWLRGPFLLAVVPLTLLVICLIAWGIYERRAAQRVQAELTRMRDAGYPIGNASLSRWFVNNTTKTGTQEWHELLQLATAVPVDPDVLPYVGTAPIPESVAGGARWPEEADVAAYLDAMRPVIQRIGRASRADTAAVWQPIQFQGFDTLLEELQESRNIIRLLQLETEYALHQRDAERALRALDSMQHVAEVFDWPFCIVGDLVQIALRGVHQSMIRRSLSADIWSEEQLRLLTEQLGPPRRVARRWQDVIAGERAMLLASLDDPGDWELSGVPGEGMQWLLDLPSVRQRLLQAYRRMEAIAADDVALLQQRSQQLSWDWRAEAAKPRSVMMISSRVYQLFLPAVEGYAGALAREETSRRFALTALAIKRFQLQQGRWPERLAELGEVGLPDQDWQTVGGGPFGYEIADEGAYLWSYDPQDQPHVSATRPTTDKEGSTHEYLLTQIR